MIWKRFPYWLKTGISLTAVYATTSVHHVYGAWLYNTPWRTHIATQGVPFLVLSLLFLILYHWKSKRIFFWLLVLISGFFFIGAIGLYEGAYNHVLKNILYFSGVSETQLLVLYPPPKYELPNDWLFEISGVFTFFIAMHYSLMLFRLGWRHNS